MHQWHIGLAGLLSLLVAGCGGSNGSATFGEIKDFRINYPNFAKTAVERRGSTHEITYNSHGGDVFWITAPNYDFLVEVILNGSMRFHPMPAGSAPHGIEFDRLGRLWTAFEGTGEAARIDADGEIAETIDLGVICPGCTARVDPHGLGVGSDGETMWYTGKLTDVVGKIAPDGTVTNFLLPTPGATPIYIRLGPDGHMWFTELVGNRIGRITADGVISQFDIPTANSRPIAIVPEPGGQAMWFTQEAGNKVARIDIHGVITEFPVPKTQANVILAGLAFDNEGNLWVQQYVDANNPEPPGADHIIRIDRAILRAAPADLAQSDFAFFEVPTRNTVLHRIIQGPDGNMWFIELKTDKVAKLFTSR